MQVAAYMWLHFIDMHARTHARTHIDTSKLPCRWEGVRDGGWLQTVDLVKCGNPGYRVVQELSPSIAIGFKYARTHARTHA